MQVTNTSKTMGNRVTGTEAPHKQIVIAGVSSASQQDIEIEVDDYCFNL